MLASGLLCGWLREKLKSMPKLNGSGKIKMLPFAAPSGC